ncbi:MAG: hypothetical protein WCO48_00520 [Candidatus Taylorbacteria bacterium]
MKINESYKKIVSIILLTAIVFSYVQVVAPQRASAVAGIADVTVVTVAANTSPTELQNTVNSWMERIKNFILDRLATAIANAILNQMTASVINWINNGFQGSPSFMTNPEDFFLDAADQVTGQFIAETGIMSQLCSPFSINIRANLALGSAQSSRGSYACTLRTVVANAKNIPNNITLNGQNIQGFMDGDFRQGGWVSFNSIMMDPQNDPFFAYHSAVGDIRAAVTTKKNAINLDLSAGAGFMSFKVCDPVPVGGTYIDASGAKAVNTPAPADLVGPPAPPPKNCHTETPGSAISNSLTKTLGVPFDKLTLANNINAIIDALVSQMVMQVLGGGLRAMSSGSSGGPSYTSQIYDTSLKDNSNSAYSVYGQSSDPILGIVQEYKSNYDTAVSLMQGGQANLNSAKACLAGKYSGLSSVISNPKMTQQDKAKYQNIMSDIQSRINSIDSSLQNQVSVLLSTFGRGAADGYAKLAQAQNVNQVLISNSYDGTASATAAASISAELQAGKLDTSRTDLQNAQNTASSLNSGADSYNQFCNSISVPVIQ